ncbi:MAG: hypothetical protein WCB46_10315 [Methanoregula sp.]
MKLFSILVMSFMMVVSIPVLAMDHPDEVVVVCKIPKDMKPCPVCNKIEYLVMEDSGKGFWTIRCENPSHYPYFLVMCSGIDPDDAIKIWCHRGKVK